MTFKPGKDKTGGRKPGVPNKRTQTLVEVLTEKGYNPVVDLIEWAAIARSEFNKIIKKVENNPESPFPSNAADWVKIGVSCANGLMPYVHAKRKPLEGDADMTPLDAEKLSTDELLQKAKETINDFSKVTQ